MSEENHKKILKYLEDAVTAYVFYVTKLQEETVET